MEHQQQMKFIDLPEKLTQAFVRSQCLMIKYDTLLHCVKSRTRIELYAVTLITLIFLILSVLTQWEIVCALDILQKRLQIISVSLA